MIKKNNRLVSVLLTVILIISIALEIKPMTVLAEENEPYVYVDGVGMYDGEYLAVNASATTTQKPSGGYAYYNAGVLTLHNYVYSGEGYYIDSFGARAVIYSRNDLDINFEGDNSLSIIPPEAEDGFVSGIFMPIGSKKLNIKGAQDATLAIEASSCIIAYDTTVEGGFIDLRGEENGINALYACVNDGDMIINSMDCGILCSYGEINDGNIYIKALKTGAYFGEYLNINGGNIKIDSDGSALSAYGEITFDGGNTLLRKTSSNNSASVISAEDVVINKDLSAVASEKVDGTAAVSFNKNNMNSYNYIWIAPQGKSEPEAPEKPKATVNVSYRTHIQTFGWEGKANDISTWKSNGTMSGTSGLSKRLEGINIVVNSAEAGKSVNLGVQYTTHCQSYGWLPWSANGEMNGTEGEAKRLEAIKIQLTGADKDSYDIYYRVHAQTYGWLGWAKNGAPAGTAGYAKRLEGIQIVVVKKGESFNQKMENITSGRTEAFVAKEGNSPIVNYPATSNTNPVVPGAEDVNVAYRTHVQSYGWQGWKYNGQMSGTSGKAKRLEGINIELRNQKYSGDIVYTTHVQKYGWQGKLEDQSTWKKNGQMAGTSGEAKRLEAICINLTGEMAANYDIYYRVHAQSYGWLGWAKNGEPSGTAGYGKRLEGIQIVLVPKGGAAPGDYQGVVSVRTEAYISK